jgi:hypothetical protein
LSSSPAIVFLLLAEKRSQVEERLVVCDELKSATRTPPQAKNISPSTKNKEIFFKIERRFSFFFF